MSPLFDTKTPLLKKLQFLFQHPRYHSTQDRMPRLVFLGRRGAGKTTLLNTILEKKIGEASAVQPGNTDSRWKSHSLPDGKKIEVLDTRGFQTANSSTQNDTNHLQTTLETLQEKQPDIFLFLVKAKEVNSAINVDLDLLSTLLQLMYQHHQEIPAVVVVVTQCDELDPPYINLALDRYQYPEEWEEKIGNVQVALEVIHRHLELRKGLYPHIVGIIPTAAFICFRPDGSLDPDPQLDHRWNINLVAQSFIEEFSFFPHVYSGLSAIRCQCVGFSTENNGHPLNMFHKGNLLLSLTTLIPSAGG